MGIRLALLMIVETLLGDRRMLKPGANVAKSRDVGWARPLGVARFGQPGAS